MATREHVFTPAEYFIQILRLLLLLWHNSPHQAQAVLLLSFLCHTHLGAHTHTHTHTHTRQDCSKWVISWSQRRLPTQRTTTTSDEHRWPQRDSNPQSQQSIAGIAFTQLHRDRPTTTPTLFIYCSFLCNNSSYLTYTNITSFTLNTISSGIKITKNKAKYLAHSCKLRIDEVTENALTLHIWNNLIIKWL